MEHESHYDPESSVTAIGTKIFGGLVAAVIIGGVLYVVYTRSGLDTSANIANAYDTCKSGIVANLSSGQRVEFLNTPDNTQIAEDDNNYTLTMKLRLKDGLEIRNVNFNCAVAKPHDGLAGLVRGFFH